MSTRFQPDVNHLVVHAKRREVADLPTETEEDVRLQGVVREQKNLINLHSTHVAQDTLHDKEVYFNEGNKEGVAFQSGLPLPKYILNSLT